MQRVLKTFAVLTTLLLAAACGTNGIGDLGGILNPSGTPSTTSQSGNVNGTVTYVDTQAHRIDLDAGYTGLRQSTKGTGSIFYDSRTRIQYQGRDYRPEDLERGDQVSVLGSADNNGRFLANTITVTRPR